MRHNRNETISRSFKSTGLLSTSPATFTYNQSTRAPLRLINQNRSSASSSNTLDFGFQSNYGFYHPAVAVGLGIHLSEEPLVVEEDTSTKSVLDPEEEILFNDICMVKPSPTPSETTTQGSGAIRDPSSSTINTIPSNTFYSHNTTIDALAPIGLFADFNMFHSSKSDANDYHASVNPLDITAEVTVYMEHDSTLPPSSPYSPSCSPMEVQQEETISEEVVNDIVKILSKDMDNKISQDTNQILLPAPSGVTEGGYPRSTAQPSYAFFDTFRQYPEPVYTSNTFRSDERKKRPFSEVSALESTYVHSPVLNAHQGVDLGDLIHRAELWRSAHPAKEIDHEWLIAFAGKLSIRGELLDNFRCYVSGCTQTNKRKDHILVHVGSHVNVRPFVCKTCDMRFLRKNECKRHEAGHLGLKPFTCDLCPSHVDKSFARLDLLRRHVKRKHHLDSSPLCKEGVNFSRRKTKRKRVSVKDEDDFEL